MNESELKICGHGSGTPSIKNMYSYLESRYQSYFKDNNGQQYRKGLVAVRRLKALTDEDRIRFRDTYQTIVGRNRYDQNLRGFVYKKYDDGHYYSDCSSSICATYEKLGYKVGLLNTTGIYQSSLFTDVPATIIAGHIVNPEVLKIGDCLEFAGNKDRIKYIGHVEAVYDMPQGEFSYEEIPVEASFTVEATELNIREKPTTDSKIVGSFKKGDIAIGIAKSGEWFKTNMGWISRKYLKGWIREQNDRYWWNDMGAYPISTIREIHGAEYAFDRDGWMLTSDRISPSGAIFY